MSAPVWLNQSQEISTVFTRGTRRQALPVGDGSVPVQLAVLAAIAARRRFELPQAPSEFEPHHLSANSARIANDAIRTALLKYFRSTRVSIPEGALQRVFTQLKAAGLTVHPFDYVQLAHLAGADQSLFDASFRRWIKEKSAVHTAGEITADNWLTFGPAERRDFISALHVSDAKSARLLLADALPNETASVRGKLISAIEATVTQADQEFLEPLLADRAKSVKETVRMMLSGLPGSTQNKERLDEAASRLSVSKTGITRKRKLLIEQPLGLKNGSWKLHEWYEVTFKGIDPLGLANRLEVEPSVLCNLIEQPNFAFQSILQLARQDDVELMVLLIKRFHEFVLHRLAQEPFMSLRALSPKTKDALWSVLVGDAPGKDISMRVNYFVAIYGVLHAPMSSQASQFVVKDKRYVLAIRNAIGDAASDEQELIEKLAVVLDSASYPTLKEISSGASPLFVTHANQLMSLLEQLGSHAHADPNREE